MTRTPHGVYLVEDEPETRARLVTCVERHPALAVVGSAGDLAGALQDLPVIRACEALLVDLGLPDGDGSTLIAEVSALEAPPCILVLSALGDEASVVGAIEAGALGYLFKGDEQAAVAEGLLKTIDGQSPISPAIAGHLLKRLRPTPPPERPIITAQETRVLNLISRGYRNGEIGPLLGVSTNTVTTHIKSVYRKLAVHSRCEAVFEAQQLGILKG